MVFACDFLVFACRRSSGALSVIKSTICGCPSEAVFVEEGSPCVGCRVSPRVGDFAGIVGDAACAAAQRNPNKNPRGRAAGGSETAGI